MKSTFYVVTAMGGGLRNAFTICTLNQPATFVKHTKGNYTNFPIREDERLVEILLLSIPNITHVSLQ